jgi:hypothetical protein
MKFQKIIDGIVALALIAFVVYWFFQIETCGLMRHKAGVTTKVAVVAKHSEKTELLYQTKYDTIKSDTVKLVEIKYKPLPYSIDTLAVLRNFYAEHFFKEIFNDSNIVADLFLTIQENKVKHFELAYKDKRPQIINNYRFCYYY